MTEFTGGCTCRCVRYRLNEKPMFIHCCHCRWCQRETGASFALNALIEAEHVQLLSGTVEIIDTPSNSGKGQRISRCPTCRIALWSNYGGGGDALRFVRVGTLDEPDGGRRMCTSIRSPSNPGWSLAPASRHLPSTTIRPNCGPRQVWRDARP